MARGARAVAASVEGAAFQCDVGQEKDITPPHRGDRAAVRPDRAILLQCRHRRRLRSAVGECRRQLRRAVAAKLGDPRHGACLCGAASDPAHEGARRRLFPQHDLRGRSIVAGRQPGLFDHQARRGRLCRKSRDLAQGPRHQGLDPVPAGRRHQHAALDPEGPAIRRRRPHARSRSRRTRSQASSRKPS